MMNTMARRRLRRINGILLATLVLSAVAWAETPYFPLNVGDTWTYEYQVPGQSPAVETRSIDRSDLSFVHFDDFHGQPRWFHRGKGRKGLVTVFDRRYINSEHFSRIWRSETLYDFSGLSTQWEVDLMGNVLLSGTVTIGAREETVTTPAGTFENCYRLDWQPNAIDAGLESEWFAPNVGLVRYTTRSRLGTIDHRLRNAVVGGVRFPRPHITPPGVQTRLHLDRYVYFINQQPTTGGPHSPTLLRATLSLTNRTGGPIQLDFDSGQVHDLVIRGALGQEVWRWSTGRAFTDHIWQKTIPAGGEETLRATVTLRIQGLDLPPGDYSIEFFTTSRQRFAGMAAFQVQHTY